MFVYESRITDKRKRTALLDWVSQPAEFADMTQFAGKVNDVTELWLDRMSMNDFDAYFAMKSDNSDIAMSGFATAPNRAELLLWTEKEFKNPNRVMLVARNTSSDDSCVGYLFLRLSQEDPVEVEVSYGVAAPHRCKCIGSNMLVLATDYIRQRMPLSKTAVCWVAEDNLASIRNVVRAGYFDTGRTRETHFLSPTSHFQKMRKFILTI